MTVELTALLALTAMLLALACLAYLLANLTDSRRIDSTPMWKHTKITRTKGFPKDHDSDDPFVESDPFGNEDPPDKAA